MTRFFGISIPFSIQTSGKYIDCKSFIIEISGIGTIWKLTCDRIRAETGIPANWKQPSKFIWMIDQRMSWIKNEPDKNQWNSHVCLFVDSNHQVSQGQMDRLQREYDMSKKWIF